MDFTAIDVAIGLVLLYLILALMCSTLQKFIAGLLSLRAKHLYSAIGAMLDDQKHTGLAKKFYDHARIRSLAPLSTLPSYIPSETFAHTLIDLAASDDKVLSSESLASLIKYAAGDATLLKAELGKWFDDVMDRASGSYKRLAQAILLSLGFLLAIGLNVSTLEVARALWTEPLLSRNVVSAAEHFEVSPNAQVGLANPIASVGQDVGDLKLLQSKLDQLSLPIGWSRDTAARFFTLPQDRGRPDYHALTWYWLAALVGWALTALATSLGSQFWFNTLGNLLNARSSGAKPASSARVVATVAEIRHE